MDAYHQEIGERIRKRALQRRLSQNKLAALAGVSRPQMTAILNAKHSPTVRTLRKIADALEVDVRDLLPLRTQRTKS